MKTPDHIQQKKLISNISYGHEKHLIWLQQVTQDPEIIEKFKLMSDLLASGEVPCWVDDYYDSFEYNQIVYQCDKLSKLNFTCQSYMRHMKICALTIVLKTGSLRDVDSVQYFPHTKEFGVFDKHKQKWLYVSLADVETQINMKSW